MSASSATEREVLGELTDPLLQICPADYRLKLINSRKKNLIKIEATIARWQYAIPQGNAVGKGFLS
jgi:hypothetical protein